MLDRPVERVATDVRGEVLQDPVSELGMHDLGVELQPEEFPLRVGDGRVQAGRGRADGLEALRRLGYRVAVREPDRLLLGDLLPKRRRAGGGDRFPAVLAAITAVYGTAEQTGHQLFAVADPEHRNAELQQSGIDRRGVVVVHGRRSAGQDDSRRLQRVQLGRRHVRREHFGVDVQRPQAAGDQVGELASEVYDGYHVAIVSGERSARTIEYMCTVSGLPFTVM